MSDDVVNSTASQPHALTPANGLELERRRLALLAAAGEDARCVTHAEKEIKRLSAVLDKGTAAGKNNPGFAALYAQNENVQKIKARIADFQRQVSEARASSRARRKELEELHELERRVSP